MEEIISENRHVLLAPLSDQPQVITFTLDLLLQRSIPISEVIVIHPKLSRLQLLHSLAVLNSEFIGDRYVVEGEGQPLSIRLRSYILQQDGVILNDTTEENEQTARIMYTSIHSLIHNLKQHRRHIHLSVDGGNSLISSLALSAAFLSFDQSDEVWHVYIPDTINDISDKGKVMHVNIESGIRLVAVPIIRIALWGDHLPKSPNNGHEQTTSDIRIRIIEEPLTPYNLTTIISALTELSTKYWLIMKRRFSDLIEYVQTQDVRFVQEAQIAITRVTYNSPFSMDWKIDLSAPSVAEAIVTTIDGITQRKARLEKAELENQVKVQQIKEAEQKSGQEQQTAAFEREKQALEIERQRLELLEMRLEVQKKGIEYALEIANKTVNILHPSADAETRAVLIQTLLPNILQLQNGKGLELALPASLNKKDTTLTEE